MDNSDRERSSENDGWMWWNFFFAASSFAFALRLVSDADEWWEFATICVMLASAAAFASQGARSALARRRRARAGASPSDRDG